MRQGKDQTEFKECLDRLANGTFTMEDWNYFRERDLNGPNFTNEERKNIKSKAIKVCALNKDTKRHNIERIYALGTPVAPIRSLNKGKGASSANSTEAQGLLQDIILARGSQILLTTNLWQEAGLTNGAVGTVMYIIYAKNEAPEKLPIMVICKFDQYIGPSYLENEEKCVPIFPIERHWTNKNKEDCMRKMLSLKPGYAISIHSSQGGTLENVIVNLGKREFATGLTYVAPSRVKKIQNLYFDPMPNFSRFISMRKTSIFKQRLLQDKRERASDARYVAMAREKLNKKNLQDQ